MVDFVLLNIVNARKTSIKRVLWAFGLMICATLLSIFYNHQNVSVFFNGHRELPIYSVNTKEKKIALTFDVGDESTIKILNLLDKYNIKATFFLVGSWIDRYHEEVKEIDKRGHEIGNHSNTHPDMTKLSSSEIVKDISINDAKVLSLTSKIPVLFRCPSGAYNNSVIETVKTTGHICVQWSVDSIDWKALNAENEYERVVKNVKPGSIILFHNNGKYTIDNLPKIIAYLKKQEYNFVKVSDLIYKDNYYIDYSGKQIHN
jgi:peptidoglycan-N-acetylglucosamine deacetylase